MKLFLRMVLICNTKEIAGLYRLAALLRSILPFPDYRKNRFLELCFSSRW